ncbi:MAG: hypothetical protein JNK23_24620 [Opitutaceae bacterium]|nr:hypothetical protein [Opitutaceae bacterium]
MSSAVLPFSAYPCIRTVDSFAALAATPFADGVNALCWPRPLPEGFAEIVAQLGPGEGLVALDEARLRALPVGAAASPAIDLLLADLERLRALDLDPVLNLIHGYPRDDAPGPVATDVFSFHADSAPVPADTWLCTYHGPPSEGLPHAEALRRVDDPATRAALLRDYGGPDDAGFREHLHENCYDLHYAPQPGARPWSFGVGHLWRIATEYPGSPVPPCVHRAPTPPPGAPPRLLLIA